LTSVNTLLKRFKSSVLANRTNYKGNRVNTKYVIIESDDWGAIRTPSKDALTKFTDKGIDINNSVYKYDALASESDLDALFNLLLEFKDVNGSYAKFTANTIVANPDFAKIRQGGYTTYHYEPFTDTLARYPEHSQSFAKWQQAIKEGLFKPQFHGREHLNIKRWLERLRAGDELTRFCFDLETTYSGEGDYSFMEAYDWDTKYEVTGQNEIIQQGLQLFYEIFGYHSASFIAPCYNWDMGIEPTLLGNGVKIVQGRRVQLMPTGEFDRYKNKPHHFGEINANGIHFNIRNCFLEPSLKPHKDWVDSCLAQVNNAFFWGKPAVVCSHRLNYIGFIEPGNRDRGLKDLKQLLQNIMKKWPEVEFITTDQLMTKLAW
jgi:hypothetical protein